MLENERAVIVPVAWSSRKMARVVIKEYIKRRSGFLVRFSGQDVMAETVLGVDEESCRRYLPTE